MFAKGPLKFLSATLRIEPDGKGGSLGHYTLNATAAKLFGTAILNTAFFSSVEKNFTALAKSAEEWAAQNRDMPFEMPVAEVTPEVRRRLDEILERIAQSRNDHSLSRKLADWMLKAQEVNLERIRPQELARR